MVCTTALSSPSCSTDDSPVIPQSPPSPSETTDSGNETPTPQTQEKPKKTEGERGRRAAARVALVYAPPQGCIVVLFAEVILAEVNPILYVAIGPGHQLVIAARKVSHVGSVALMSFSARHLLLLSGAFGLQIGVRIVSRAF